MPVSAGYVDAVIAEQIAKSRAMLGLMPYPFRISALEGLAERCTSVLNEGIASLESLRGDLRAGLDAGTAMRRASWCSKRITAIEEYGLPPLQYQTRQMALLNEVLRRLHHEMALPFPRPTACGISDRHYISHFLTQTIYVPMGEALSIQHFAHLYHELGHYLLRARANPRLEPVRKGIAQASQMIEAHYTGSVTDNAAEHSYMHGYANWLRERWPNWLDEGFCDLLGVLGGGPASAWAYLHMAAKRLIPPYTLNEFTSQTHPPGNARMAMMCAGLRLAGCGRDADMVWSMWKDVVDTVGEPPGPMYKYAVPEGLLCDAARIIYESLGKTDVVLYDPGSRGREGWRMRTLLNDAWDVFWRLRPEEFQRWEAAELGKLGEQSESA